MPPCAAMECARRGESWNTKVDTLYPSSDMVADADAPASPAPTTITLCRRLLAGFTSFIAKRCWSHFCSMGPSGIFDLSSIMSVGLWIAEHSRGLCFEDAQCCGNRHNGEADGD